MRTVTVSRPVTRVEPRISVINNPEAYERMWREFYGVERPVISIDANAIDDSGGSNGGGSALELLTRQSG